MVSVEEARRIALADELSAHPRGQTVVVGCGNLLRGDDGVGPILIRHLWDQGTPEFVTLVDGGTAGMDVAFKMRGAEQVIIIDASTTGASPGTIYRVPGEELEDLPPLDGLHTHQFRWDHALAFGRWLLGDQYPDRIEVFLIEAAQTEPGADLSAPVEAALHQVLALVRQGWGELTVELSEGGDLRLDAETAARHFPHDALVAGWREDEHELWLLPLVGPEGGGLLLKQRNLQGDRSALVAESLPAGWEPGPQRARWDDEHGALRVSLAGMSGPGDPTLP